MCVICMCAYVDIGMDEIDLHCLHQVLLYITFLKYSFSLNFKSNISAILFGWQGSWICLFAPLTIGVIKTSYQIWLLSVG